MVYATSADISAYLGVTIDTTTTPTAVQVETFIERNSAMVEELADRSWEEKTVTNSLLDFDSFTTYEKEAGMYNVGRYDTGVSNKYVGFKLDDLPLISVTELKVNQGSELSEDWKTLTEGTDFIVYLATGLIMFINSSAIPFASMQSIDVSYTHGIATGGVVPLSVTKLVTLMTVKDVLREKQSNASYNTIDSITIETISISKSSSDSVTLINSIDKEIEHLQNQIIGSTMYMVI